LGRIQKRWKEETTPLIEDADEGEDREGGIDTGDGFIS